jgi:hypothetical protein
MLEFARRNCDAVSCDVTAFGGGSRRGILRSVHEAVLCAFRKARSGVVGDRAPAGGSALLVPL